MRIEAKELGLVYPDGENDHTILKDVNIKFESGENVIIAGPSGSGKSSLIYLLSTLKNPTTGCVYYNDKDITHGKNMAGIRYDDFGFVFQQHFLIPYMSVVENVCIARKDRNLKKNAIDLLDTLGLSKLVEKKPYQLSGGERQRVAIARALVKKPSVIFADEPTASLDKENAMQIYGLLRKYSSDSLLIMTTHDMSLLYGDERVIYIDNATIKS